MNSITCDVCGETVQYRNSNEIKNFDQSIAEYDRGETALPDCIHDVCYNCKTPLSEVISEAWKTIVKKAYRQARIAVMEKLRSGYNNNGQAIWKDESDAS